MQNYVRDRSRGASPQTAEHRPQGISAKRQASGANAKVSLKKAVFVQKTPNQPGLPSRGLSNVQNSSAVIQPPPRHRPLDGQDLKQDPYDTDAESLDTTVNLSTIQGEDSQEIEQQNQRHQHDEVEDFVDDIDCDEGSDEEVEFDDYQFTQQEIDLLHKSKLQHVGRETQLEFLNQAFPGAFHTVEGDSYPSTTDGIPTEWEEGRQPSSINLDDGESRLPSLQGQTKSGQFNRSFLARSLEQGQIPNSVGTNQMQKPPTIPRQIGVPRYQPLHQQTLTSQPPLYNQINPGIVPNLPMRSLNQQSIHGQNVRTSQQFLQQPPHPLRVPTQSSKLHEPHLPLPSTQVPHVNVRLVAQPQSAVPTSADDMHAAPDGDYDDEKLFAMGYSQLKEESFDYDPRAGPKALTGDLLQKPLVERLEFVQKNFDAGRQSDFFSSLPIAEWEEAGDWFLDQFQSIIQRTRESRRAKRKLAQDFEDEVDKRHTQVLKKQRQVEEAMKEMKTQGEGLVAKSPKPSKGLKLRKG